MLPASVSLHKSVNKEVFHLVGGPSGGLFRTFRCVMERFCLRFRNQREDPRLQEGIQWTHDAQDLRIPASPCNIWAAHGQGTKDAHESWDIVLEK